MVGEDLYVDLFSNSSLELYPNNRVSSFTAKLDRAIDLEGPYDCALAQMITPSMTDITLKRGKIIICAFPETLFQKTEGVLYDTIPPYNSEKHKKIFIEPPDTAISVPKYVPKNEFMAHVKYAFVHEIPEDQEFSVGDDVIKYINQLFHGSIDSQNPAFNEVVKQRTYSKDQQKTHQLRYLATVKQEKNDGTLSIIHRDADVEIVISGIIARVFGFNVTDDEWVIFQQQGNYRMKMPINVNASRPSLISVYTNVILPHRVGDTSAPMIRACTIPQVQHNTFLSFEFNRLHYLPVALKYIQEVLVEVRGNDGELIPFQAGILYLRLHFRPRRQR